MSKGSFLCHVACLILKIGTTYQGIYPDLLHILDLAIYFDMYASSFLHWTDTANKFPGRSRDQRLVELYKRYITWCVDNRCLTPIW